MINVNKMLFNFATSDKLFIYNIYAVWEEYFKSVIEPVIDEALSSFNLDSSDKNINILDLNIGNIQEEFFFEEFPARLREELVRAVRTDLGANLGIQERKRVDGACEEQWTGKQHRLQTGLEIMFGNDETSIVRFVQECFDNRILLERAILSLDSMAFGRVLFAWLESKSIEQDERRKVISLFAKEYPYLFLILLAKVRQENIDMSVLIELSDFERLDYPNIALSHRQADILNCIIEKLPDKFRPKWSVRKKNLDNLANQSNRGSGKKALVNDAYQWLMDERVSIVEKRKRIVNLMRAKPSALLDFVNAIEEMQQVNFLTGIMDDNFIVEIIDVICQYKEPVKESIRWKFACDWILAYMDANTIKSLNVSSGLQLRQGFFSGKSKLNVQESVKLTSSYLFINNAGLVLLTPWFPRLFSILGLLNDEGKDFKDTDSRKRAVFIIQRMVTFEERDYTMMDLIFNRVLVNLPLHESLPSQMQLTDQEIEAVESMLEGVKGNWPNMANTSIKGFQHSFVERKGVLEIQEEKILLTVEPRSYDLLLDSIPWGYKLVRFPWLEKRIHVKWRDKE